jgi:hypothetical protein
MVSKRWFVLSLKTRWVRCGADPMGWRRIVTVRRLGGGGKCKKGQKERQREGRKR